MTQFVPPRATALLLAVAVLAAAIVGGAALGQVGLAGAEIGSGDRPITKNIDLVRIRDTRTVFGGPIGGPAGKLGTQSTEVIEVADTNGIPPDAEAVCINLTVLDATTDTFVTAFGALPRPNASTVNPGPGDTTVNGVLVPLDAGNLRIYNNAGSINYFIDVSCYTEHHNHDERYYTEAEVDAAIADAIVDPVVPSGRTITGGAIVLDTAGSGDEVYAELVSLTARAAADLTDETINFAPSAIAIDDDATCTGTAAAPTAPPGKVCLYIDEAGTLNVSAATGIAPSNQADKHFGFLLSTAAPGAFQLGVGWAYTAP